MTTSRSKIFEPRAKPVYAAIKERITRTKSKPELTPKIYDHTNYTDLLETCRTVQRKNGNQDSNLITEVRCVLTGDDTFKFGASGIPSANNAIPSHREVTGDSTCVFPCDASFNSKNEICELNNMSGGYEPKIEDIQFALMAFHKLGFIFAEKVKLTEIPSGIGKSVTHHFSRENLITKIEALINKSIEQSTNSISSSEPASASHAAPANILKDIDQNSPPAAAKRQKIQAKIEAKFDFSAFFPKKLSYEEPEDTSLVTKSDPFPESNSKKRPYHDIQALSSSATVSPNLRTPTLLGSSLLLSNLAAAPRQPNPGLSGPVFKLGVTSHTLPKALSLPSFNFFTPSILPDLNSFANDSKSEKQETFDTPPKKFTQS